MSIDNIIEYYDEARKSNISIIINSSSMVQAIGFCFKDNPFPLSDIFSTEMKTFIAMPPGFRGVPFPIQGVYQGFTPPPIDPAGHTRKGCSGCGQQKEVKETVKADGSRVIITTEVIKPQSTEQTQ
ncbi:hypothetical protein [Candidatus Magnetobacterium casense]|uniref:Uncharacterized protein n=1 Tax=Candidatus Magnetobacterium casense TaxID=1455061 RepID=A0ABS6RU75_9BACT|nr:hypothetical protein [Candidatus Magnetobacterium casensis]MBV6340176.1 hypothetical protein [Candidatus Magnetobacterium casensis]